MRKTRKVESRWKNLTYLGNGGHFSRVFVYPFSYIFLKDEKVRPLYRNDENKKFAQVH